MALTAAPPAVEQVAQRFAATTRGVVSYRLHRVLDVRAAFLRRHEDLSLHAISVDGTIVRVRIQSYTIDGKPASAADSQSMTQAYESPQAGQRFRLPFDPHYSAEYEFSASAPETMAFTSTIRDAAHGNGRFTYDTDYDVISYTYAPNALPPHASSGSIADKRGEVLPGYWGLTRETQDYKGRYGPFAGRAHEDVDFSGYRRFADVQSALATL
jgi:hypothetical protein